MPKIVRCCDADNAAIRDAQLFPDVIGFVIRVIDGDGQAICWDAKFLSDQIPSERDRLGFEVITKAEIAQHLEKRMVARRITNIVQIVMLAARTDAFLRTGGALIFTRFKSGKQVLELHHAGELVNINVWDRSAAQVG